jgi:hypothetical protein
MTSHVVHVDSTERNPVQYPSVNDLTVSLNVPVYDITSIKLVSAKIDFLQPTIHRLNNKFGVDSNTVTLYDGQYTGNTLASNLLTAIKATGYSNIDTISYDESGRYLYIANSTATGTFTFNFYRDSNGYTDQTRSVYTPASVLGLSGQTVGPMSFMFTPLNLNGPTNLILRVTTQTDDLYPSIYTNKDTQYIGRLCTFRRESSTVIEYKGDSDTIVHQFTKGPERYVNTLRIRWYQSIDNVIVPYNFYGGQYFLKLEIVGTPDKLSTNGRPVRLPDLPPPTDAPSVEYPRRLFNSAYIMVAIIVFTGILLLLRVKSPGPPAV